MMVLGCLIWMSLVWAGPTLPGSSAPLEVDEDTRLVVAGVLAAMDEGRFTEAADAIGHVPGADARYLEALARYEQGSLHDAEVAARAGLAIEPQLAPLQGLLGLIFADLGRGDEALASLDRAIRMAQASGDAEVEGRALLNRGVVHADRGELTGAGADWAASAARARAARLANLAAEADAQVRALSDASGGDLVGRVAEQVRLGDLKGAAALIPAEATTPRAKVHALIARGMIARTEGRVDTASAWLREAIDLSDKSGMLREGLSARLEMAYTLLSIGSVEGTGTLLREALERARGTSFVVRQVELHLGLARLASRVADAPEARAQLDAARSLAARATHPMLPAEVAEVEAIVRGAEGDFAGGAAAAARAAEAWEAIGAPSDAARASCEQVRLLARAGADRSAAIREALGRFSLIHDPRGPAHVAISEGLGSSASARWTDAIDAFARAVDAAHNSGDTGLEQLARVNVMEALRAAGHSEAAVEEAKAKGFTDAVAWHGRLQDARAKYDAGRAAFDAKRFADAIGPLDAARKAFEGLGEQDKALAARRAVAWSRYNVAVTGSEEASLPVFDAVIADAVAVSDADLALHARVARAIALGRLGRPEASAALSEVVGAAGLTNQPALAAAAWAAKAKLDTSPLEDRAKAARAAAALDKGEVSAAALYDVAYDAYQGDELALALALTNEVMPFAGRLAPGVRDLHDAAQEALGGAP